MVSRYQKRLPSTSLRAGPGPLLDPIDIRVEVPRVKYEKLSDDRLGEPWAGIQARVEAARDRQRARFKGSSGMLSNADALVSQSLARPRYASTAR